MPRFNDLLANKADKTSKEFKHYETVLSGLDLKTIDEKAIKGINLTKGIVILNFWASWCTPCLEEFPSLVALRKKYPGEKLKILAISSDDQAGKKDVQKTIAKFGLNFDIVHDPHGDTTDKFMISAIPVSLIYKNGKVIEMSKGAKDFMSEEFQLIFK